MIRKENFPSIEAALWGKQLWSPSYFAASCGGAPLEIVKKYITKHNVKVLDIECGPAEILDTLPEIKYYGFNSIYALPGK